MPTRSQVACLRLYPLAIPLRRPFVHARKQRSVADPLVVEAELADGTRGYGETLPREYVTGETVEGAVEDIRGTLLEELLTLRPRSFADALERIDALPMQDETGEVMTAARAAVELALLDAYSRHFGKPISEAVGWLGLPGFGTIGGPTVRYSGVLSGGDVRTLRSALWKMRLFGLRDFKLKVGLSNDIQRIRAVAGYLGWTLGGKTTLRLDANGAWTLREAIDRLTAVADLPITCIEQPLEAGAEEELLELKPAVRTPIMHDESLITPADAQRLIEMGVADAFNIRISKNGGFLPSIRLAHLARKHGAAYQLGCMVGETSILSAAGRRFLENVPGVAFAEGSYGRFLLADDVADRPVRFGFGGRGKPLPEPGWGITVNPQKLKEYAHPGVIELPF